MHASVDFGAPLEQPIVCCTSEQLESTLACTNPEKYVDRVAIGTNTQYTMRADPHILQDLCMLAWILVMLHMILYEMDVLFCTKSARKLKISIHKLWDVLRRTALF